MLNSPGRVAAPPMLWQEEIGNLNVFEIVMAIKRYHPKQRRAARR